VEQGLLVKEIKAETLQQEFPIILALVAEGLAKKVKAQLLLKFHNILVMVEMDYKMQLLVHPLITLVEAVEHLVVQTLVVLAAAAAAVLVLNEVFLRLLQEVQILEVVAVVVVTQLLEIKKMEPLVVQEL
jgi:hypothetical protein